MTILVKTFHKSFTRSVVDMKACMSKFIRGSPSTGILLSSRSTFGIFDGKLLGGGPVLSQGGFTFLFK